MNKQTIFQKIRNKKETQINSILTSRKEFWFIFILLAAFNGFHMWLYQIFEVNNMLETHLRIVISLIILYIILSAGIITTITAIFRKFLIKSSLDILCSAAHKIAKGDFSIRIKTQNKSKNNNYIDDLFDNFNLMTEELASLTEKLKALSTTDELTKLNNRRSFMQYFDTVWKQNHRLKLPVTVLLLDIDYFKKYNDTLGHLEGDEALKAVALCLKNQIKRETDFVARFGGEEFVCLLPYINKDEAIDYAKTLVQNVENLNLPHPKSEVSQYITISAGLANTIPDSNNSLTQLLDNADKALYSAKASGRNRAVMY